jgi:hypothetical protein
MTAGPRLDGGKDVTEREARHAVNWPAILFSVAIVLVGLGVAGAQQVLPIDRYSVLWTVVTWGGFGGAVVALLLGSWLYFRQKRPPHPDFSLRAFVDRWLDTEEWSEDPDATLNGTHQAFKRLQERARLGLIAVWGRKNCLFGDTVPLSAIPPDFWDRNTLDYLHLLSGADDSRGRTESLFSRGDDSNSDIHLNLAEVESAWPKPRRRIVLRSPITFEKPGPARPKN